MIHNISFKSYNSHVFNEFVKYVTKNDNFRYYLYKIRLFYS